MPGVAMSGVLKRFWAETAGVAAIEFALLAPTLLVMLLASMDLSAVLSEREGLDHVLRSGAQLAMADAGSSAVLAVMQGAASEQFPQAAVPAVTLSASRFCACPNAPATSVGCGTICTGNQPTYIFYNMSATKSFSGILFPRFDFAPALQVEVR